MSDNARHGKLKVRCKLCGRTFRGYSEREVERALVEHECEGEKEDQQREVANEQQTEV